MLRHSEPVGPRDGDRVGGHGLSGAGHDKRGSQLCAGATRHADRAGCRRSARATSPGDRRRRRAAVDADFQAGYADDLDGLAANVSRCVATGVAGLSIEDARGGAEDPLYPLPEAVERVRVAKSAIDGADVLLTARAECFLYGHPDPLREAITPGTGLAEAGADVLYAPGVRTREDIAAIVDALPTVTRQRVDVVGRGRDGERPGGARCAANQRRLRAVTGRVGRVPLPPPAGSRRTGPSRDWLTLQASPNSIACSRDASPDIISGH